MKLLVFLSGLCFVSFATATTVKESTRLEDLKVNNVVEDNDFSLEMFKGCSLHIDNKYYPIKTFEKAVVSNDSLLLSYSKALVQFDISANNRTQVLLRLGEQQNKCAKRVREYRRHPAY